MTEVSASVEVDLEARSDSLAGLIELAARVDRFVGEEPPESGYGLAEAVSAIFNRGTIEEIQTAFALLKGWSFRPKGGW